MSDPTPTPTPPSTPANPPANPPAAGRRDFLTKSVAAASAAAVGALDLSRSAHAAGSDVIKVGMIGCGSRNSGAIVQALTADPGARLVAMCDLFLDRVKAKRELIRKEKPEQTQVDDDHCFEGFDGYKRVIECSDVVLIANAAKFHPLHAMAAIQAGKHVFVEKPHGIDPAGVKLLAAAAGLAKEKKLCLASGLQSRHHAGMVETVQRIHDGAIGEVVAIEENFLRAPYGLYGRQEGHDEVRYQCGNQYHFNWLSGDDVTQSLVHNLDRASWVLRGEAPAKAHGIGGRSTSLGEIYGNVFDHHSVIYEFANGVRLYAFCRTIMGCYNEYSSVVLGSKGRASVMACRIWGAEEWTWKGQCNPYQVEHDKLFAAIRSGTPVNNGDYMARSTLIGIMGQLTCYTGKEVTWEQVSASDFQFAPAPEACSFEMEPPVKPGPDGTYPVFTPGVTKLAI